MQLQVILRNKGLVLDKEVTFVGAKSKSGEIGILNGHMPLITSLVNNSPLKYTTLESDTVNYSVTLDNAFLEIDTVSNNTSVKIITESFSEIN